MGWKQVTLVVPTRPNPDSSLGFEEYHWRRSCLETQLIGHYGGFTRFESEGAWHGPSGTQRERGFTYLFALPEGEQLSWVRDFVSTMLEQQAVFLSVVRLEGEPIQ